MSPSTSSPDEGKKTLSPRLLSMKVNVHRSELFQLLSYRMISKFMHRKKDSPISPHSRETSIKKTTVSDSYWQLSQETIEKILKTSLKKPTPIQTNLTHPTSLSMGRKSFKNFNPVIEQVNFIKYPLKCPRKKNHLYSIRFNPNKNLLFL
jgi:hypothetical protein